MPLDLNKRKPNPWVPLLWRATPRVHRFSGSRRVAFTTRLLLLLHNWFTVGWFALVTRCTSHMWVGKVRIQTLFENYCQTILTREQIELFFSATKMATFLFNYTPCRHLSQMIFAIIFFHTSEYFLAISFHGRSNVPLSSLLISKQYVLAMGCSILEYILEIFLFPQMKEYWWISNVGLGLVLIGEVIRKMSIITAGRSFTHLIRTSRDDQHKLITHGIYRFIRHPGYCGFFIWATGIQIMILNPLCTVAFVIVLWRFFSGRITYEEYFLRQFFGSQYKEYAQHVPSGVPFVK